MAETPPTPTPAEPKALVPKIATVKLKILKPADVIRWLKFLVYGDTGAGKTYLCGTAAEVAAMCPILFCDLESGTLSIRGRDVDLVEIETIQDLTNVFNYIRTHPDEYKTVIIDTISEYYTVQMDTRLRHAALKDPHHDRYVPEMQDWLHSTMRVRSILRIIRALPVHVLVTATPSIVEDKVSGGIHKVYPDLPGKLAPEVGKYFDVVGYLYTKLAGPRKVVRELQCQPFNRMAAKDRSGMLGAVLTGPTMEKIFNLAVSAEEALEEEEEVTE